MFRAGPEICLLHDPPPLVGGLVNVELSPAVPEKANALHHFSLVVSNTAEYGKPSPTCEIRQGLGPLNRWPEGKFQLRSLDDRLRRGLPHPLQMGRNRVDFGEGG